MKKELFLLIRKFPKNPKGVLQFIEYFNKGRRFWNEKSEELIRELYQFLHNSTPKEIIEAIEEYGRKTGFPEVVPDQNESEKFYSFFKNYGEEKLARDLIRYGSKTKLVGMLIAPELAAMEGSDIDLEKSKEFVYSCVCYSLSSDIADNVLDMDMPRHPKIPFKDWVTGYKVTSAILLKTGEAHLENLEGSVKERFDKGLKTVSEAERLDLKTKDLFEIPFETMEKIYLGKIAEIEKTIFDGINILSGDRYPQFPIGASHLAFAYQISPDDEEDLNQGKVPNPSYFLEFFRRRYRRGERPVETVIRKAENEAYDVAKEHYQRVSDAYDNLPQDFSTRPFFNMCVQLMYEIGKGEHEKFLKGKTLSRITPKLSYLASSLYTQK